jgi:hypothetical protein
MTQSVHEQIGAVAAVEPELHLLQVGREMLGAQLVLRAHDGALQQGECGLDRVGVELLPALVFGGVLFI